MYQIRVSGLSENEKEKIGRPFSILGPNSAPGGVDCCFSGDLALTRFQGECECECECVRALLKMSSSAASPITSRLIPSHPSSSSQYNNLFNQVSTMRQTTSTRQDKQYQQYQQQYRQYQQHQRKFVSRETIVRVGC